LALDLEPPWFVETRTRISVTVVPSDNRSQPTRSSSVLLRVSTASKAASSSRVPLSGAKAGMAEMKVVVIVPVRKAAAMSMALSPSSRTASVAARPPSRAVRATSWTAR